ncbi:Huntingtin-interacting protein 1 [Fasciola gigantica]|uniref:Huntingtin-interacting protein 1 n=1 Tax=Fasciola gigantica TaxID=46835 RepID=A0A504YAR2_FASGI|nr:Huntingtin-interacting protein 1 [Fasciola gigantica]
MLADHPGSICSENKLNADKTRLVDLQQANNELETAIRSLTQTRDQLKEKLSLAEQRILSLEEQNLHTEKTIYEDEEQLFELNNTLKTARERCMRLEAQVSELPQVAMSNAYKAYLSSVCRRAGSLLEELLTHFTDSELLVMHRTSPEFLLRCAQNSHAKLMQIRTLLRDKTIFDSGNAELPLMVSELSVRFYETLFHCKVLRQFAPDFLEFPDPDKMCHELIGLFQRLGTDRADVVSDSRIGSVCHATECLMGAVEQFQRLRDSGQSDEQQIADQLEQEMNAAANAIRTAEEKFKELFTRPVGSLSEDQLRVKHIFNYCSALMIAVGRLVEAANDVQKELKEQNCSNVSEFYKQHSRWTQGFLSAAKSVGACANVLVEVADIVAGGDAGSLGRMIVVAQEVAVSTTHLFVASRIKVDPKSANFSALKKASREVTEATGTLVASVKAAIDTHEAEELDFSCLTLTQAKRMEMETQVHVLQLESELVTERRRLAQLRRENYQDSADVEVCLGSNCSVSL